MKRIVNPWVDVEGYGCFGCAPHNESGLRLEFFEDGDGQFTQSDFGFVIHADWDGEDVHIF